MFEIRDNARDGDGWTGVEALTLEDARFACETIAHEGYELPLHVVHESSIVPIVTLVGFDESGGSIWQSSNLAAHYKTVGRAA